MVLSERSGKTRSRMSHFLLSNVHTYQIYRIQYDVRDPEDDPSGKQNIRKASAKELVLIPAASVGLAQFERGAKVFAKYPETDTFYNADVRGVQKSSYTLIFEGEEDNKEMSVDKRFVLSTQMK